MTSSWSRLALRMLLVLSLCLLCAEPAAAQISALVSPGRLNRAHASLEGLGNCLSCHSAGQRVATGKCLGCHKPVAERIAKKIGVHRGVTDDCVACHVEHAGVDAELRPFDQRGFKHAAETGFALDGLHAPLQTNCAACHRTRSFLSVKAACASCHTDAHKGTLGPNCATCHTTTVRFAQTRTSFDHSRTDFPLTGSHLKVACASCHTSRSYTAVKFESCANCHADAHKQRFGASCANCHTTATWTTTRVNHALTAFPLRGRHEAVPCAGCHKSPAMKVAPVSTTCGACHADPHRGQFKQDCGACHTESGFRNGQFDHSTTGFPLVDQHAKLSCAQCHAKAPAVQLSPPVRPTPGPPPAPARAAATPRSLSLVAADYRGLSRACVSCHADVHRAELGTSCETCHSARTFAVTAFTHRAQRPFFGGQHAAVSCAQCHRASFPTQSPRPSSTPVARVGFSGTPTACASCHRDVHLGQVSSSCETCHSVDAPKFRPVGFAHETTRFSLTGAHAQATCESCHKVETGQFPSGRGEARRLAGVGTECATCHQDVHLGQVSSRCETCHSGSTPKFGVTGFHHEATRFPLTGAHGKLACEQCHKVESAQFPAGSGSARRLRGMGTDCATCHTDVHGRELSQRCDQCHATDSFELKRYTHQNARTLKTFFTGPHLKASCASCHKPERKIFGVAKLLPSYRTQTTCVSCHTDVHKGALGSKCETCHRL